MNDQLKIQPCLLEGTEDLPCKTPLYKYMSIEAFLYLLHFKQLIFSRFVSWPDAYEVFRYEYLKQFGQAPHEEAPLFAEVTKDDFYGSCWTLQTEDIRLYDNKKAHALAEEDLQRNGSASMWETYCRNGGVRIKTSIGKIDYLLGTLESFLGYRGQVYYEARKDWQKTIKSPNLISTLLMKSVAFRHEAEYRYILVPTAPVNKTIIPIRFGNLFEFLDEVLVSPGTNSTKWISRTLYNIVSEIAIARRLKKQFCKISQLYGPISEEIAPSLIEVGLELGQSGTPRQ
ncbi:MAG: hypothetical protein ACYC69_15840 [Thermodesulfovibrionales bacterium]